jgi:hypothetical protein
MEEDRPQHADQAPRAGGYALTGRPPAIWLGDFARALDRLEAEGDETLAAVAAVLGLGEIGVRRGAGPAADTQGHVGATGAAAAGPVVAEDRGAPRTGARAAELAYVRTERPEGSSTRTVFEIGDAPEGELPPPRPLVARRATRGIVSAALSTTDEKGPVDLGRVVDRLARGETIERLPRRTWPTMRHGAQVLVDGGTGMVPYAADVLRFLAAFERHVGAERLTVARFVGCPTRGAGVGARRSWSRWRPPRPGMPIALLTDLGVGRAPFSGDAAPAREWLDFAAEAHSAGCPVVALVPYRAGRVSLSLRRAMAVVHVHERMSAARVRATLGGVLRRPS